MWGILNNVYVLLGIIVSCISITATAFGLFHYVRNHQVQSLQSNSSTATNLRVSNTQPTTDILHGLDFWDKATVIGEGTLVGLFIGFIVFIITLAIVFILLIIILTFSYIPHMNNITNSTRAAFRQSMWINFIISVITGIVVGLMVGVVAGVNETKERANDKRKYIQQSLPQKTTEIKIANAPIVRPTGDFYADRLYTRFEQRVRQEINSWSRHGTIILFASSGQLGEIVNAVEDRGWYSEWSTTELSQRWGKKQTYVKEYREFNGIVYAAVFKDLDADTGYILWSDRKQPVLALSQARDVACIDWR